MTPNRSVALLTPILFAPLAGAISAWVAELEARLAALEGTGDAAFDDEPLEYDAEADVLVGR